MALAKKKKKYNARVSNVENGTFTPLVFSLNGGMGRECKKLYSSLRIRITQKIEIVCNYFLISCWKAAKNIYLKL